LSDRAHTPAGKAEERTMKRRKQMLEDLDPTFATISGWGK
jgi:hypothetical protein